METKSGNDRAADGGGERLVTKGLPPVNVGEVYLNDLDAAPGDGVPESDAGMSEGSRIDNETGRPAIGPSFDRINEFALVIGLPAFDFQTDIAGTGLELRLQIGQSLMTINLRFPLPQSPQIGAIEDANEAFTHAFTVPNPIPESELFSAAAFLLNGYR